MQRAHSLAAVPAYLMAATLVSFPLMDAAMAVWPPRAGEMTWRFGAAGLFTRAMMTPLLGLFLACVVAFLLEQRRVLRALSVVSGVVALALLAMMVFFALDAVQMRVQVRPDARGTYDRALLAALAKYGLGLLVVLAFATSGWRASRGRVRTRRSRTESAAVPLVQAAVRPATESRGAPTA